MYVICLSLRENPLNFREENDIKNHHSFYDYLEFFYFLKKIEK